ncbi:MAG: invasion associated locus B family protein [Alphaproteobacteria bacterium]|nr:invasion associated locus B family protein [Alphaproteobacteria bacterium]
MIRTVFRLLSPTSLLVGLLTVFLFTDGPASAAEPKRLAKNGDWIAFEMGNGDDRLCFMTSEPTKAEGNYTQRGEIRFNVSHWPGEKRVGQTSVVIGYQFKDGSDVEVEIDRKGFTMFTQGDYAWALSPADDEKLVDAMKKGLRMVVRGTSWRGTDTKDTYSLVGFTKTYQRITQACGL